MTHSRSGGFALVEALIAALLMATAIVGLSQLVTVGVRQAARTRDSTAALTLAQAKLEELRSLAWQFDVVGTRVSSAALTASPPLTLTQDVGGWVEGLDRFGESVPVGLDAHFRRRWAIAPFQAADLDTLVLQVCVFTDGLADGWADACVHTLRTRKP